MNDHDPIDEQEPIPLDSVDPVRAELEKAFKQIAEYKLLLADFDNARKRLVQDAERQRKYAHESLARDLLGGVDNLDRTIDAAKKAGETGSLLQGVTATVSLLIDVLKRYGVVKIDTAPGAAFDPNKHQAVMEQPSADVPPGAVLQVLQSGFMLHDRVLRPATVIVAAEAS